jgi:hypothetical protein
LYCREQVPRHKSGVRSSMQFSEPSKIPRIHLVS